MPEHYFTPNPASPEHPRRITIPLAGDLVEVNTAAGTFSPDRLDIGTTALLANTPQPPPGGDLLDLGCGWGPIALTLAKLSPRARVWAVDVNERSLDLTRRNAEELGLDNVQTARPEDVPDDIVFRTIWSNPPIRIGKNELHNLLERWIPRLDERSDAWLVISRNLGADSMQRWLTSTLGREYSTFRSATSKGFRILRVRHHGSPLFDTLPIPSTE